MQMRKVNCEKGYLICQFENAIAPTFLLFIYDQSELNEHNITFLQDAKTTYIS